MSGVWKYMGKEPETKTDKTTDDKSTEDNKDKPLTAGELRQMVHGMVQEVAGTLGLSKGEGGDKEEPKTTTGPTTFTPGSVRGEVEREIAKIKEREKRDANDAAMNERLSKVEKATEVVPVERRRVHKFMGWGENG